MSTEVKSKLKQCIFIFDDHIECTSTIDDIKSDHLVTLYNECMRVLKERMEKTEGGNNEI